MRRFFITFLFGGLLGKLLGLARELLMASMFGTGVAATACRLSLSCVTIPGKLLTSEAITGGFMPLLAKANSKDDKATVSCIFWFFLSLTLVLSLCTSVALYNYAPFWVHSLAPGLNAAEHLLAVDFLQIVSLGLPAFVTAVTLSILEMIQGNSGIAAIQASMQSLGLLAGIACFSFYNEVRLLAWGLNAGWFAHLAIALYRTRALIPRFSSTTLRSRLPKLAGQFFKTTLPLLPVPLMVQGNLALERVIASYMGGKTIPALDYSRFICETGMALVAMPLGYAILSHLSHYDLPRLRVRLIEIISPLLLIGSLCSYWLFAASDVIVDLLFGRGKFSQEDVLLTASILSWSVLGLWAHIAGYVLLRGLNISQENKKYSLALLFATVVSMLTNWFLWPLYGPATLGIAYLCYSVSVFVAAITYLKLWRSFIKICLPMLLPFTIISLLHYGNIAGIQSHILPRTVAVVVIGCIPLTSAKIRQQFHILLKPKR
ncbi:MAG: lipid II flippase MurJ [Halodesulfovibrio sp.]